MASAQQSESTASASDQTERSQASQPPKIVDPVDYWMKSTSKKKDLEELRARGLLPDPQILH
jgi:hypothetical protein